VGEAVGSLIRRRHPDEMEKKMKRLYAIAMSLGLLLAIPGLVAAQAGAAPVSRDQYVKIVIDRGLAQRGVPYSWAGGDINGPTLGKETGATTVGFDSSGLIQYIYAPSCRVPRAISTRWARRSLPRRPSRAT
jgi:hypothetical protein